LRGSGIFDGLCGFIDTGHWALRLNFASSRVEYIGKTARNAFGLLTIQEVREFLHGILH
jgi:hypothetical protein